MKLVLHIGTEKTGTTTLQASLRLNHLPLAEQGQHVLRCAGLKNQRAFASYALADDKLSDQFFKAKSITTVEQKRAFNAQFEQKFHQEISQLPSNIQTVISSSEHFSSRLTTESELKRLKALISSEFSEVAVIIYLREQVSVCTSLFSTSLRAGGIRPFAHFMKSCTPDQLYYNYDRLLSLWESVFGRENIHVRRFEREHLLNGDVVDDFYQLIGVDTAKLKRPAQPENESINPVGQILGRAINAATKQQVADHKYHAGRQQAISQIYQGFKGKGLTLSQDQAEALYAQFEDCNAAVCERYFPEDMSQGRPLFSSLKSSSQSEPYAQIDEQALAAVIHELLQGTSAQIHADVSSKHSLLKAAITELEQHQSALVPKLKRWLNQLETR